MTSFDLFQNFSDNRDLPLGVIALCQTECASRKAGVTTLYHSINLYLLQLLLAQQTVTIVFMNLPLGQPVTFLSTDQLELQGLLFGNPKAATAHIVIHGLGGDVFSQIETIAHLASNDVQVLFFNNRGHDTITRFKRLDASAPKGYQSETIGAAHEVFTDCVHDIQGAVNFLEEQGAETIQLTGHSTGCQKTVYYLSQQPSKSVKGATLLCTISDYASFIATEDEATRIKATDLAKKLVKEGRPHELLPLDVWPEMHDAQRFLSLFTPESTEEIFSYAVPDKAPEILQSVKVPLKIVLAEKDEYADRPASEIAAWFKKMMPEDQIEIEIIEGAGHNLERKGALGIIMVKLDAKK